MGLSERILEILENSGLTPSEFADKIEVQRSAISHITSGRNKPSLEFIIKIKKAFPDIDTDWLVFGTEKEEKISENIDSSSDFSPTLFDLEEEIKEEIKEEVEAKISEEIENIENTKSEITEKETEEIPVVSTVLSNSSKKIQKIVFFYEDGTFEDFSPNRA